MPQSNVIFFYLFAAFFVFITMRGELPKYLGFLLASPVQNSNTHFATGQPVSDILGQVQGGAPLNTANANNTSPDWKRIGQIAQVVSGF